ncbi:hypothetical protein B0H11DRAFT_2056349 [Mycena galericulata]|nr:hypothetical protein B0H11DRAFT_2056349 [Mycena galericulata]
MDPVPSSEIPSSVLHYRYGNLDQLDSHFLTRQDASQYQVELCRPHLHTSHDVALQQLQAPSPQPMSPLLAPLIAAFDTHAHGLIRALADRDARIAALEQQIAATCATCSRCNSTAEHSRRGQTQSRWSQRKKIHACSEAHELASDGETQEQDAESTECLSCACAQKREELADAQRQLDSDKTRIESILKKLDADQTQLDSDKMELAKEKAALESRKLQLAAHIAAERTQLGADRAQLAHATKRVEADRTQLAEAEARLVGAQRELVDGRAQVAVAGARLDGVKRSLEADRKQLKADRKGLLEEWARVNGDTRRFEGENARLREVNASQGEQAKAAAVEARAHWARLEAENTRLRVDNARLQAATGQDAAHHEVHSTLPPSPPPISTSPRALPAKPTLASSGRRSLGKRSRATYEVTDVDVEPEGPAAKVPRKLGISHLDLLYATGAAPGAHMRCRLCLPGKENSVFAPTAPWNELAGHALATHASECAVLLKLGPAQLVERRQRLGLAP